MEHHGMKTLSAAVGVGVRLAIPEWIPSMA